MTIKVPYSRGYHAIVTASIVLLLAISTCFGQDQQERPDKTFKHKKNVIRYNLSGAMLFGTNHYVVFGYERVIRSNQSISINFGRIALPKFIGINTDSGSLQKDLKNSGYQVSIDYRFYLRKENKFDAPHGLYIGPYYSYNRFMRDNEWHYKKNAGNSFLDAHTDLKINTVGFQLGYQFIFWKKVTLDLLMIGPGIGFYNYKTSVDSSVDAATKEQLYEALEQLLTQKFPGMNYVFSDKKIEANGSIKTTNLGYRYIVHIGFNF
jgi:hypothetical protein